MPRFHLWVFATAVAAAAADCAAVVNGARLFIYEPSFFFKLPILMSPSALTHVLELYLSHCVDVSVCVLFFWSSITLSPDCVCDKLQIVKSHISIVNSNTIPMESLRLEKRRKKIYLRHSDTQKISNNTHPLTMWKHQQIDASNERTTERNIAITLWRTNAKRSTILFVKNYVVKLSARHALHIYSFSLSPSHSRSLLIVHLLAVILLLSTAISMRKRLNFCVWVRCVQKFFFVKPLLMLNTHGKSDLQYLWTSVINIQITFITVLWHFKLPPYSSVMTVI